MHEIDAVEGLGPVLREANIVLIQFVLHEVLLAHKLKDLRLFGDFVESGMQLEVFLIRKRVSVLGSGVIFASGFFGHLDGELIQGVQQIVDFGP